MLTTRRPIVSPLVCAFVLACAAPLLADAAEAEKLLESKGLKKQGAMFVLPDETQLIKQIIEVRKAQVDLRRATAEADAAEKKLDQAKKYIAMKELELRKSYDRLAKGGLPVAERNQLIARLKSLESEIASVREGPLKKVRDKHGEANGAFVEARQQFIDSTLSADALAQETTARYEALAEDDEVAKALETIATETGRKVALGPTTAFTANSNSLKLNRTQIAAESIPLKVENNVSSVEVMLNGKTRRTMIVDTGAGLVTMPWGLAQQLGMAPSEETPVIKLRLADGKIIEGWRMSLQSVQVGAFTVENVECAVLPQHLTAAEALLGGSYLKNFVVKLDPNRAQLELARIQAK